MTCLNNNETGKKKCCIWTSVISAGIVCRAPPPKGNDTLFANYLWVVFSDGTTAEVLSEVMSPGARGPSFGWVLKSIQVTDMADSNGTES